MSSNLIDYQELARQALQDVVRKVLVQTADQGLPGDHHFYLTFDTTHPGVEISPHVRNLYPEEMTIVLQYQFWNLMVDQDVFAVTLRFGGAKHRVSIPFEALTTFVDPAAEFGLNLDLVDPPVESEDELEVGSSQPTASELDDAEGGGGDVVSIERFRKKPS